MNFFKRICSLTDASLRFDAAKDSTVKARKLQATIHHAAKAQPQTQMLAANINYGHTSTH